MIHYHSDHLNNDKIFMETPKIIHLCWFSGDEYPYIIAKCIQSWREQMPDYTIRIWTYQDALATGLLFVEQALSVRKWAFAADAVRAYALYTEGGVYLDSDVYLKKNVTPLLNGDFVSFIEKHTDAEGHVLGFTPQPAFLASPKGHPFAKALVDFYRNRSFVQPDGSWDMQVIAPEYYARISESFGFRRIDETQRFAGVTLYSSRLFASTPGMDTPEAYGIHACEHNWAFSKWHLRLRYFKQTMLRLFHRLKG
jgi:hypothetical protein